MSILDKFHEHCGSPFRGLGGCDSCGSPFRGSGDSCGSSFRGSGGSCGSPFRGLGGSCGPPFRGSGGFIVAVSGGADSVALLVAMVEAGYQCVAAHCNFHLRGAESNRDMRSVAALCKKLGVDLYVRDFDVDAHRRATGESVEMACRSLRYKWFAELLDNLRAKAIAVAHHREDNIETFFLNLTRGSGLSGLTGMRYRNGYIIRPLLEVSRAEIEAYLTEKGIPYVNDSTNAENEFARNRWRNVVLPIIEENFPGAMNSILASISHLADNRLLYDALVHERREAYLQGAELQLDALLQAEKQPRMLLFEILREYGFNMSQIDNIISSSSGSGLTFAAGDTLAELDRGVLRLSSRTGRVSMPDSVTVSLARDILSPVHIVISDHPVSDFKPERNPAVAYFDKEIMDGSPEFVLRRWMRGDRIRPYGKTGTKLLSDLYRDAKYSAADKRNAWVLTRNGEIIWAVGLRASGAFSIRPETRRYLELCLCSSGGN